MPKSQADGQKSQKGVKRSLKSRVHGQKSREGVKSMRKFTPSSDFWPAFTLKIEKSTPNSDFWPLPILERDLFLSRQTPDKSLHIVPLPLPNSLDIF